MSGDFGDGDHGHFKIVMIRHGKTEWNEKNRFSGWFDADLSEKGRDEAVTAGKILKAEGYEFDVAHTSVLRRAHNTLNLVLQEIGQTDIPIFKTWRLNERHFGGLTGLSEAESAAKYGTIQIKEGKSAIISAHNNSLRGIVKQLDDISDVGIMGLNIPSGIPFVYELDTNMKPINQVTYLGNHETVKKAMADALDEGKDPRN